MFSITVALYHFLNAHALIIFLRVQYTGLAGFFDEKHPTKTMLPIVAQSKILQPLGPLWP